MDARSVVERVRVRDPDGYALHRAVRIAVVAPAAFAFSFHVFDNPDVPTFTVFGCFALLLFVDFPGDRSGRLTGYLMLGLLGVVLISLGTLASRDAWLAVLGMVVVGFVILFAGVLSAAIAAGGRAALLLFILPVTLPGHAGAIGPRLVGWAVAVAVAVPAAMLVWPPREHDELRRHAAETCAALADVVTAREGADDHDADAACARVSRSLDALRAVFRGTAYRPVGLTTGSRALMRLVEELEWLGSIVIGPRAARVRTWPRRARVVSAATADVLRASAGMLAARRRESPRDLSGADGLDRLDAAMDRLLAARRDIAAETRTLFDPAVRHAADLPYQGHELGYTTTLVGSTVRWAAQADARPVADRLLGRGRTGETTAPLSPALRIATSQFDRNSVWLRNSVRGALGLGLAVLLAQLTGTQHSFWVVLGALAVLRSNALSTGSTALRALAGTLVGFAIGGVVIAWIGGATVVLWLLLPVAVFVASFAPAAISFAAGQAGFTAVLLVLFNIIDPVGWTLGLVRVEDIALGCTAGVVVGVLLWPRGASAAIGTALRQAYGLGVAYLAESVAHALTGGPVPVGSLADTLAGGRRLDDALRQYLAERGAKTLPLRELTAAANGATRLRLAGEAIATTRRRAGAEPAVGPALSMTLDLVGEQAAAVGRWYAAFADSHVSDGARPADRLSPPPGAGCFIDATLAALRHDFGRAGAAGGDAGPAATEQARRLLWTSLYLEDLRVLAARLTARQAGMSPRSAPSQS